MVAGEVLDGLWDGAGMVVEMALGMVLGWPLGCCRDGPWGGAGVGVVRCWTLPIWHLPGHITFEFFFFLNIRSWVMQGRGPEVCLFVYKFTDSGSCRSVALLRMEPTPPRVAEHP